MKRNISTPTKVFIFRIKCGVDHRMYVTGLFLPIFHRKRYEKAEVEYVMAKLDLHKKTEVKEQLTEHLCAIIQQNELRKAHKLEELMQQLQLEASEEELERSKGCVEVQKEEDGSALKEDGTVQSSKPSEEEIVKGGDIHQVAEPPKTEQDCKTLENGLWGEAVVS